MKSVIRWAVKNSPAMNVLMFGVLIMGAVSLMQLKREVFPQFDLEILLVSVPYPGASPAEVEQGVCQKIEEATRSIDGVKKAISVAQEGSGFMILTLETGIDVQKTLTKVRSEVDRIPSFPELAEDPEIEQITFTEPAIKIALIASDKEAADAPNKSPLDAELELRELAERVREGVLNMPNVSRANIIGSRNYQIDIEIPENRLREYGLTLQQVAQIVRQENIELPIGSLKTETQEVLLRGNNKQLLGDDIAKIPLVTRDNGVVLTIADLGNVRDGFEDITALSTVDGRPGLVVAVDRTRSEDLLAVVDDVKKYVATAKLPSGYELKTWGDVSVDVRDRMNLLAKNGLQGLVLVFLMLAIFLDLRLAFWVAMGIPIAVLGACAVLLISGQSLNMLSMFAFLMALGIVVDDAIVVGENVFAHRHDATSGEEAAIQGTYEVFPSVAASVSTTIIAFMPLFFVSGVMGKFIAVMPLAVIAMLAISLVESALILPCHLAHSGSPNFVTRSTRKYLTSPFIIQILCTLVFISGATALGVVAFPWHSKSIYCVVSMIPLIILGLLYPLVSLAEFFHEVTIVSNRFLDWFVETFYLPFLRRCLRWPFLAICVSASLMLMSFGLVTGGITPFVVFPKTDSNRIEASVVFPDGTSGADTEVASRELEASILRVADKYRQQNRDVVRLTRRSVGSAQNEGAFGPESRASGSHIAKVDVELSEASIRGTTSQAIIDEWRAETPAIDGAESLTFGAPQMGPGGAAIEFKLLADKENMADLEEVVELCKDRLKEYAGVLDVKDDSSPGKWEYQLRIKDKAKSLGITLTELAQTVRGAYYGEEVMRLQRGRHEVKLMVRYPADERKSVSDFEEIRLRTSQGEFPLLELAQVDVQRGYSEINRIDQKRSITITADVREGEANAQETVADLRDKFLPDVLESYPGVSVLWEGQAEQTQESVQSLFTGFACALLAMYVLLTVQFRSYFQPLIIMFIIPFGVVGAIWGHFAMGLMLTMFTLFGLVALTGVVVNDSIVLIDFINLRFRGGMVLFDALIDAGRRRFRPVLLTSITTIAGLTPMLMETSFQAQFLIPLAATLVFGLLVATGLVLLLIPTLYSLYQRVINQVPLYGDNGANPWSAPVDPVPASYATASAVRGDV